MARHNDSNGIGPACLRDRTGRFRPLDRLRDIEVGAGRPGWNRRTDSKTRAGTLCFEGKRNLAIEPTSGDPLPNGIQRLLERESSRFISALGNRTRNDSSAPASDSRRLTAQIPPARCRDDDAPEWARASGEFDFHGALLLDARQYAEAIAPVPALRMNQPLRASAKRFRGQMTA